MVVMKFGGSSVKDPEAVQRVVGVVGREKRPRLVVVSALAGVTDGLLDIARLVESGEGEAAQQAVRGLRKRHEEMAVLARDPERRARLLASIDALFDQLEAIVKALAVVEEVSPRSRDTIQSFGEIPSSHDRRRRSRGRRDRGTGRRSPDDPRDGRAAHGRPAGSRGHGRATSEPDRAPPRRGHRSGGGRLHRREPERSHDDTGAWGLRFLGRPLRGRPPRGRDPDLDRRRRHAHRGPAGRLRRPRRAPPVVRRGVRARLLRGQGPAPEHHSPRGAPRRPGAHPELAPPGGAGNARHARGGQRRRRPRRHRVQARLRSASTSPRPACSWPTASSGGCSRCSSATAPRWTW